MSENILDLIRQLKEGEISQDRMVQMLVHDPETRSTSRPTTSNYPEPRDSAFRTDLRSQYPLLSMEDIQNSRPAPQNERLSQQSYRSTLDRGRDTYSYAYQPEVADPIHVRSNYLANSEFDYGSPNPTVHQFMYNQQADGSQSPPCRTENLSMQRSTHSEFETVDFTSKSYDNRQLYPQTEPNIKETDLVAPSRPIRRSKSSTTLRKPPLARQIRSSSNSAKKAAKQPQETEENEHNSVITTKERTLEDTLRNDYTSIAGKSLASPQMLGSIDFNNQFGLSAQKFVSYAPSELWASGRNFHQAYESYQPRNQPAHSFLERNKNWQSKKSLKIMKEVEKKSGKETEGCTFRPVINNKSQDQRYSRLPPEQRLYETRGVKKNNAKHQILRQREEDFKENYTFKPALTPVPAFLKHNNRPRNTSFDVLEALSPLVSIVN